MTLHRDRTTRQTIYVGMAALVLSGLTGCATSSDMDQFKQSLTQRLDGIASSLQADTRRLQAQLDGQGKRQQELSRSVEAVKSGLEGEFRALRAEMGGLRTDTKTMVDELVSSATLSGQIMKDLRVESTHMRKALDDYAGKMHQELGKIEAVAQDGSKEIHTLEQTLAAFSGRLEPVPSMVKHMGSELHGLSQTLMGSYKLEESALRERLKAVEQVLKQLEPATVKTTQSVR
jgi:hypothetical protein